MAHLSPYLRNGFRKDIPIHISYAMILILLLIELTSGCVFTYIERSNQLKQQCKMQAVREYLNAVTRVSFLSEAFQVKAENCTANLQPFIGDSTPVIQFEV